jgi:hypothetical protein
VLGVAAFSLFIFLGYSADRSPKFIVPAALILVSMIISFSGRIETTAAILCMLLFFVDRAALIIREPLWQWLTWLGSCACSDLFYIRHYGSRDNNPKGICISLAVIFGRTVVLFSLLLIFVYLLPATEWFGGTMIQAGRAITGTERGDFIRYLVLSKDAPLIFLYSLFLIPIVSALHRLILRGTNENLGYLTFAVSVLAAFVLIWRRFRFPVARYNFTVFVPSICRLAF